MESSCKPGAIALALIVLLAGPLLVVRGQKPMPDALPTCHRGQPDLDSCLKDAVQKSMDYLVNGDESLDVPPLDPMGIETMKIEQLTGPVRLKLQFSDLLLRGLKGATVDSFHADLENFKLNNHVLVKGEVSLEGNYSMEGRVLVLPVSGSGWCKITLVDVDSNILLSGSEETRDGRAYMKIETADFNFEAEKLFVDFHNLFNGDKVLGARTNQFLNENWREIMREFKPPIQAAFGKAFMNVSRIIFDQVPFDDIFPN